MKYYLITIETRYSTEEYLIPVLATETIEQATEKALQEIGFCDRWEVVAAVPASDHYIHGRKRAMKLYRYMTGEEVENAFLAGKYTAWIDILRECARVNADSQERGLVE